MKPSFSKQSWLFFDLGDTIVDTKTHNYDPMFYMRPARGMGAREYLMKLNEAGYRLGMLIDVPEAWGVNYPPEEPIHDLATAKILRMMNFVEGRIPEDNTSWRDDWAMNWGYFGEFEGHGADRIFRGRLILPRMESERKSKNSMSLFERAVEMAATAGCRAIFQGEDIAEVRLAEAAGMVAFHVGQTSQKHFYLPMEEIESYAGAYSKGSWEHFDDSAW